MRPRVVFTPRDFMRHVYGRLHVISACYERKLPPGGGQAETAGMFFLRPEDVVAGG